MITISKRPLLAIAVLACATTGCVDDASCIDNCPVRLTITVDALPAHALPLRVSACDGPTCGDLVLEGDGCVDQEGADALPPSVGAFRACLDGSQLVVRLPLSTPNEYIAPENYEVSLSVVDADDAVLVDVASARPVASRSEYCGRPCYARDLAL